MDRSAAAERVADQADFQELSPLQVFYYWQLLTLKLPKWEKAPASQALLEAKVEPIPHQVEAAMFAFRNPLAGGVILADEVGLGKTIETGLILSQLWAEGKRSFMIIAPKSLRHQWQDELYNLFYLESHVLDNQSLKKLLTPGAPNPLDSREKIIIANEHFVERHATLIEKIKWDYVIIDEAHRLRNVWKPSKSEANELKKLNDKEFGRKLRVDEYISFALNFVTENHRTELQNSTLSHQDRLNRDYKAFVAENGMISKDEYLGKRLTGEIPTPKLSQNEVAQNA